MKALIFGSTTVLSDTSGLEARAYNQAFKSHRIDAEWTAEQVQHYHATNTMIDALAIVAQTECAAIEHSKTQLYHDYLDQTLPVPTARLFELLDAVKTLKMKLAMITDEPRATVNYVRAAVLAKRASRFDALVTADDDFAPKPSPDRYLHVLQDLELDADECATIEVSQAGIDAATAAGLQVFTLAGFVRNHQLEGAQSTSALRETLNAQFATYQYGIAAE